VQLRALSTRAIASHLIAYSGLRTAFARGFRFGLGSPIWLSRHSGCSPCKGSSPRLCLIPGSEIGKHPQLRRADDELPKMYVRARPGVGSAVVIHTGAGGGIKFPSIGLLLALQFPGNSDTRRDGGEKQFLHCSTVCEGILLIRLL
jgi:hypothetical protein